MSKIIDKAFEKGQFRLYYQPKINLHTKRVESAEALIRIESGDEVIMPLSFIPQAEKSGAIVDIDRWVFNRLIEDSRYISMLSQEDIIISFNVSSSHFNQPCFLENLENIFNFTTDFLSQFEIELTEWSLIGDIQDSIEKMNWLKKKGFKLALDDFGTGFSSLLYLKDFPIDTIKIDKAFIDGIKKVDKTIKITESIIFLAKKLELNIVAEGVESASQVLWLKENGCDEIQGYYYSKPLPIDEFVRFVKAVNKSEIKNEYISWSEKYSIDNYAFDTHHMIIANILNKLYDELRDRDMDTKTEVKIYFSLLDRYMDIHFKAEEEYMQEIGFKDIKAHIQAHREFKNLLKEFSINLSDSTQKNSYNLFKILKEWFLNHELEMDKKFIV